MQRKAYKKTMDKAREIIG